MSAPVLTAREQRASVSGKKKKKKTMKNVLDIPSSLKVESHCVEMKEARKLIKILERLLPSARLPVAKCNKSSNDETVNDSQLRAEVMTKRNQLSLGVNALNRSIKQDLISSVLLANDIQPKFLINHLNLLCRHNKIPFLQMPGLREVTKNHLGFPCIAVGFKKDFQDFSEAVEEVKSISQSKSIVSSEERQETAAESSEFEEDPDDLDEDKTVENSNEPPFEYLYRTSRKERIFVPESIDQSKSKPAGEFIAVENDGDKTNLKNSSTNVGISSRFKKDEKERLKNLEKLADDDDDDDDDDDFLEVPKKKMKKDWVIDTVGTREKITYYPTNLLRFTSNPDRNKRRNK